MFCTHLNSLPSSKLLIIQDNLQLPGDNILDYVLKQHTQQKATIHYYVFSGFFQKNHQQPDPIKFYDFTDSRGIVGPKPDLSSLLRHKQEDVIVINSLAHVIHLYGITETYKILHQLKTTCRQTITLLHSDLLINKEIIKHYKYLSTFYIKLKVSNDKLPLLKYTYRKSSGKIIKLIEQYHFKDNFLITEPLKRINITELTSKNVELLPQDLTTFKIGLEDKDKQLRDQLVLPYLPKEPDTSGEGSVSYKFDQVDDWDEEDPDDDLNI